MIVSQPENYVSLNLKWDALTRLLEANVLHIDELHCQDKETKRRITRLLLSTVSKELTNNG